MCCVCVRTHSVTNINSTCPQALHLYRASFFPHMSKGYEGAGKTLQTNKNNKSACTRHISSLVPRSCGRRDIMYVANEDDCDTHHVLNV